MVPPGPDGSGSAVLSGCWTQSVRGRKQLHPLAGELAPERGHHLAGEELERAGRVGKLHRAEYHLAEQIIDAGLALEVLEIIAHGRRRAGDAMADRLQLL